MLRGRLDDPVARLHARRGLRPPRRSPACRPVPRRLRHGWTRSRAREPDRGDHRRRPAQAADVALSALLVVTNPPGMIAETDALPGEHFTTTRPCGRTPERTRCAPPAMQAKARRQRIRAIGQARPAQPRIDHHRGRCAAANDAAQRQRPTSTTEPTDLATQELAHRPRSSTRACCRKCEGCDTHAGESLARSVRAGARLGADASRGVAHRHPGRLRRGRSRRRQPDRSIARARRPPHAGARAARRRAIIRSSSSCASWIFSERGAEHAKLDVLGTSLGLDRVLAAPDAATPRRSRGARRSAVRRRDGGPSLRRRRRRDRGARAPPTLPIVIDAVYEQGITDLVPGTRERTLHPRARRGLAGVPLPPRRAAAHNVRDREPARCVPARDAIDTRHPRPVEARDQLRVAYTAADRQASPAACASTPQSSGPR